MSGRSQCLQMEYFRYLRCADISSAFPACVGAFVMNGKGEMSRVVSGIVAVVVYVLRTLHEGRGYVQKQTYNDVVKREVIQLWVPLLIGDWRWVMYVTDFLG